MIFLAYFSDLKFLISDLFFIIPLEWLLACIQPYNQLTFHYPDPGILTLAALTVILNHTLLTFLFKYFSYIFIINLFH